jgi:hypothetical protein
MAERSSAQCRQHTAQGTRIDPGVDANRRAVGQGDLDQARRPRWDIHGRHRLRCHFNAGKASERRIRLRRPQGMPPSIELTRADAVQPRNVRGRCPRGQALSRDRLFLPVVQRRRRSPRGIKSTRTVGALLRLVVCALSVDVAVPAGVVSVSMGGVNHTQPRESHVGATQRLRLTVMRAQNVAAAIWLLFLLLGITLGALRLHYKHSTECLGSAIGVAAVGPCDRFGDPRPSEREPR